MNKLINKEETMNKCIRHGEVMLVPIDRGFRGKQVTSYIVGHSETGHHHVLESKKPFKISETDKRFVIELFEPAKLVHKKTVDAHKTLTVPKGKYQVVHKTEYNPWTKTIQRVFD